jgi:cation diffusion facilitator family transporter
MIWLTEHVSLLGNDDQMNSVLRNAMISDREKDALLTKRWAALSLGLNALLAIVKFVLYPVTGSSALLAEAVHSMTDVAGSLIVISGLYLSEGRSERFPWGLYKIENFVAVISSALIYFTAYKIARMIFMPVSDLKNLDIGMVAVFLMTLPNLAFYKYESKIAKGLNSPALTADAENWKMDTLSLIVVGAGVIGARLAYPVTDRIAAVLVLLVVVRSGYGILQGSVKSLLDASVDKPTLDRIRNIIQSFDQVREVVELTARNSGRFIFVTAVLRLAAKRLYEAHDIADAIELKIKDHIPYIERVMIHYEPEEKTYRRYAVPLSNREGDISEHFAKAPFIALWDKRLNGTISTPEVLENPFLNLEKGKGIQLAGLLVKKGVDILYTKEDFKGKGPEYVLSGAEVSVRKTELTSLDEMVVSNKY